MGRNYAEELLKNEKNSDIAEWWNLLTPVKRKKFLSRFSDDLSTILVVHRVFYDTVVKELKEKSWEDLNPKVREMIVNFKRAEDKR